MKSGYSPASYHPSRRRELMSAPPTYGHRNCLDDIAYKSVPPTPRDIPNLKTFLRSKSEILNRADDKVKLPEISVKETENAEDTENNVDGNDQENKNPNSEDVEAKSMDDFDTSVTVEDIHKFNDTKKAFYQKTGRGGILKQRPYSENIKMSNGSYTQSVKSYRTNMSLESRLLLEKKRLQEKFRNAPSVKPKRVMLATDREAAEQTDLPAFVQVETLHVGQTFVRNFCMVYAMLTL